jgi:hypothetical protein
MGSYHLGRYDPIDLKVVLFRPQAVASPSSGGNREQDTEPDGAGPVSEGGSHRPAEFLCYVIHFHLPRRCVRQCSVSLRTPRYQVTRLYFPGPEIKIAISGRRRGNAVHSPAVNRRMGPSGSLESRTATSPPMGAASTHDPASQCRAPLPGMR